MRTYRVTYRVEFLSPKAPREWPLEVFCRAIDHLLADEVLARRSSGEADGLPAIALTETVSMEDGAKPLTRVYVLRHIAAVTGDDPAILREALSDLLGVTPRQFEGPWNIVGIDVSVLPLRKERAK